MNTIDTIPENPELKLVSDFVQFTGRNIFLTGKAGTGKTTFLKKLRENSPKRMIIAAPTGVAAINAGGVTIHSFFQLPFGPYLPEYQKNNFQANRFNREKINVLRSLDLLVIDEISMVRADLLDGIDDVLRRFKDRSKPFGGVQLLMIGDLQQLSPVARDDDWNILQNHYETPYFFSSKALKKTDYVSIELKIIYRQSDEKFISILNQIRENKISNQALQELNKRYFPQIFQKENEGYIVLTTHNNQANQINTNKLNKLNSQAYNFEAKIEGDFPEYIYPTEASLILKEGAQVMFIKNDPDKQFYNGKIGKIENIDSENIHVRCENEENLIRVPSMTWENTKYEIDEETKEIKENVSGSFTQYPLKTAWAITIHKSQGLTFEKAIIDANYSFAHGQVYVALSRCKSLEGMILTHPLSLSSVISDEKVKLFTDDIKQNIPTETNLNQSRQEYQHLLLLDLFDFYRIQGLFYQLLKLIQDNQGATEDWVKDLILSIIESFKKDIVQVAEKFKNQIYELRQYEQNIEINSFLQERIKKAAIYFIDKFQVVVNNEFSNFRIETDNKAVRKSWNDVSKKINNEIFTKTACLNDVLQNGFFIKNYLNVRAKVLLEEPKKEEKKKTETKSSFSSPSPSSSSHIPHPELYAALKNWRDEKAMAANLPVYMIIQQKTMVELTQKLPSSLSELKNIKGLGKKRIEDNGIEILEIIRKFK